MKGSRWFIIGVVVFLGIMFLIEYHLPKKFVWNPTFARYDKQPFGCAVFDDVLSHSLPEGYSLSRETFYQMTFDTLNRKGILVVTQQLDMVKADLEAMLQLAEKGNKVMIVSSSFPDKLCDTLRFKSSYSYFSPSAFKRQVVEFMARDSLFWVGDSARYDKRIFTFFPQLCNTMLVLMDSLSVPLVEKPVPVYAADQDTIQNNNWSLAFSRPFGKGEITIVSTPLLFTNYGMLDGDNATYLFRLLSRMQDLPVVRTEGYGVGAQEEESPFRYFLSHRPLRWALYLTVAVLVLFMVFTARRRQRAIPVVREPDNKSLEFMELIGTLYFQKKNPTDLVRKKFVYFTEVLRRSIQVDAGDAGNDAELSCRIAQKTGLDADKIARLFAALRPVIKGDVRVNDGDMKEYIDRMNEIINHL